MKKITYLFGVILLSFSINLSAQAPHPDQNGDGTNVGNTAVPGGGAPIGGGVFIMMGVAAAYALKKRMAVLENKNQ